MRLGILGGTFNPIHYGHLFLAEDARVHFQLDQVLFIPNGQPPHKQGEDITPAVHRYAMVERAIRSNPAFACSDMEIVRSGPSYTVDTLTQLQASYPAAELFYITGLDTIVEIPTWRQPERVIQLAQFIAATRPGYDLATLETALPATYRERIHLLTTTHVHLSATDLRERLQRGAAVRYLTPDPVLEYIAQHQLYLAGSLSATE